MSSFDPFEGQPSGLIRDEQPQQNFQPQPQYQEQPQQPQQNKSQNRNNDLGEEVLALWENKSKTTNVPYLSGKDKNGNRFIAFKNTNKKNENEPDWRVYRKS